MSVEPTTRRRDTDAELNSIGEFFTEDLKHVEQVGYQLISNLTH